MNKKILALLMSALLLVSCMIPAMAADAEPSSDDTVETTTQAQDDSPSFNISLEDILNSDIVAGIMGSQGFVDLTQIVFDIMANFNKVALIAMGKEKVQQVVQSTFDTVAGMITELYQNKDFYFVYDPLKIIDNLFDTNTSSLTTQPAPETTDPNELVFKDGDVDMDGKITAADARLILRSAARLIIFTDEQKALADVDKDGKITAIDARIVLRMAANLPID